MQIGFAKSETHETINMHYRELERIIKKTKNIVMYINASQIQKKIAEIETEIETAVIFTHELSKATSVSDNFFIFYFFIKCMQSMTMTLFRRYVYAKLHVIWSKSLLYIFSLINHIDSLCIWACELSIWSSDHINNLKLWKLITSM